MAKISARGAREIARIKGYRSLDGDEWTATFVLTDDGRVLRKLDGLTGYSIQGRIKDPKNRTADFLRTIVVRRFGYRVK
jgi:hypothetical protein